MSGSSATVKARAGVRARRRRASLDLERGSVDRKRGWKGGGGGYAASNAADASAVVQGGAPSPVGRMNKVHAAPLEVSWNSQHVIAIGVFVGFANWFFQPVDEVCSRDFSKTPRSTSTQPPLPRLPTLGP